MKPLLIIASFLITSFISHSQDVILKRDGSKIEAKVLEVSSTEIKFKRADQKEGPLRIISISEVEEIIYEDGSWDKFEYKVEESKPKDESGINIFPERVTNTKDPYLSNGFNMDLILGYSTTDRTSYYGIYNPSTGMYEPYVEKVNYIALSLRIGNKFYFGSEEKKWRPGIQANWLRLGINIDPGNPESIIIGPKNFTIANVGMANIFKFSENIGLELNVTSGFNLDLDLDYGDSYYGIAVSPEIKLRLNKLAIGLDYNHIFGLSSNDSYNDPRNWDVMGISVGLKF